MNHPQLDFRSPHSPILWMGLGQVRDLRWDSIGAIEAQRPFASLRDLLGRVSLQNKEVTHLVQCGALDGLDGSRAALLAEGEDLARAGSVHQLAFAFGRAAAVVPETLAQRLEWEQRLLGLPVSANPVALVRAKTIDDVPLRNIHRLLNQKTTVAGVRLPGWTGGQGYYVGDGEDFVVTRLAKAVRPASLKPWQPVRLTGYWREDEWGGGWFQCENVEIL